MWFHRDGTENSMYSNCRRKTSSLLLAILFVTSTALASDKTDIADIVQLEHDAVAADLAGNADFYAANLAESWTDGMSNGEFQTKQMLLSDLRDPARNITTKESITEPKVRIYGDTAISTYTEAYDALIHGERRAKTIITTNTYIRQKGRWLMVAAHSSAVPVSEPAAVAP